MTPSPALTPRALLTYLRLALVTGLVSKEAVIAWADAQIAQTAAPSEAIIDLALSSRRSYSAIIWSLREFQGPPDYELALPLLLARAGVLLGQDPTRTIDIIMGLRLLNEEEHLPRAVHDQIAGLREALSWRQQNAVSLLALTQQLAEVLAPYASLRPHLAWLP